MNKGLLTRPQLLGLSLVALVLAAGWNMYQRARTAALSEGSVPSTGAVLSVTRDAIGCESRWPFAAHDCRVVIKIRHRPEGARSDESYIHVGRYYFLPAPELKQGDPVTGSCELQVGLRGRCRFDQVEETPQPVKVVGILAVLFVAVFALVYLRRR